MYCLKEQPDNCQTGPRQCFTRQRQAPGLNLQLTSQGFSKVMNLNLALQVLAMNYKSHLL